MERETSPNALHPTGNRLPARWLEYLGQLELDPDGQFLEWPGPDGGHGRAGAASLQRAGEDSAAAREDDAARGFVDVWLRSGGVPGGLGCPAEDDAPTDGIRSLDGRDRDTSTENDTASGDALVAYVHHRTDSA